MSEYRQIRVVSVIDVLVEVERNVRGIITGGSILDIDTIEQDDIIAAVEAYLEDPEVLDAVSYTAQPGPLQGAEAEASLLAALSMAYHGAKMEVESDG